MCVIKEEWVREGESERVRSKKKMWPSKWLWFDETCLNKYTRWTAYIQVFKSKPQKWKSKAKPTANSLWFFILYSANVCYLNLQSHENATNDVDADIHWLVCAVYRRPK